MDHHLAVTLRKWAKPSPGRHTGGQTEIDAINTMLAGICYICRWRRVSEPLANSSFDELVGISFIQFLRSLCRKKDFCIQDFEREGGCVETEMGLWVAQVRQRYPAHV
jgi:hypothetical protein